MAVRHPRAVQRLSSAPRQAESRPGRIGPVSLDVKQMGDPVREIRTLRSTWRGLETWHGIGLNRRASRRPYLGARGREISPRDVVSDTVAGNLLCQGNIDLMIMGQ